MEVILGVGMPTKREYLREALRPPEANIPPQD
jgi:hypothetical protein